MLEGVCIAEEQVIELVKAMVEELEEIVTEEKTLDGETLQSVLENISETVAIANMPVWESRLRRLQGQFTPYFPDYEGSECERPENDDFEPSPPTTSPVLIPQEKVEYALRWLNRFVSLLEEQLQDDIDSARSLQSDSHALRSDSHSLQPESHSPAPSRETSATGDTAPTDMTEQFEDSVHVESSINLDTIEHNQRAKYSENTISLENIENAEASALVAFNADQELDNEQQEFISVLRAELQEIATEFEQIRSTMASAASCEDFIAARDQICCLLETLGETFSSFELPGLQQLVDVTSIRLREEETQHSALLDALKSLPDSIDQYLGSLASEDACLQLIDFIDHPLWPTQIDEDILHDTLQSLADFNPASEEHLIQELVPYSEEDTLLTFDPEASPEVIKVFLVDAPLHAEALYTALSSLKQETPEGASQEKYHSELIQTAQRASHTLKGAANLIGVSGVANLSHELETVFEQLENRRLTLSRDLINLLLNASDCLSAMIDSLNGQDQEPSDTLMLLTALQHYGVGETDTAGDEANTELVNEKAQNHEQTAASTTSTNVPPEPKSDQPPAQPQIDDELAPLMTIAEEMSITTVQSRELFKRVKETSQSLKQHDEDLNAKRMELETLVDVRSMAHRLHAPHGSGQAVKTEFHRQYPDALPRNQRTSDAVESSASQTDAFETDAAENDSLELDSLELDRYDDLHQCAHQLFEGIADIREINGRLQDQVSIMDSLMRQQFRHINSLQHELLSRQRVDAATLSGRLQRCVRQACRAAGKEVSLNITGEQLQIDRVLIDRLADPIMHLLRNAVDHGIESDQSRLSKQKSATGQIALDFQQMGRFLQINLSDDGQGLDYQRIFQKACQKGIYQDKHQLPDHKELAELIWQPGFSTRDQATQLSGRGIGLDAVRSQIELLGGSIQFLQEAAPEEQYTGCRIQLRVPIREITQYMLLIKAGEARFALPTTHLKQIMPSHSGKLERIAGQWHFIANDTLYPCHNLAGALQGNAQVFESTESDFNNPVLITRLYDTDIAIAVDQLLHGEQLVLRSPGKLTPKLPGLAGLTILGDGTVIPVLNITDIVLQRSHSKSSGDRLPEANADHNILPQSHGPKDRPTVLVIDDSLSVRSTLKQLLSDCGFEVVTACDGLEAVDKLNHTHPALCLVDLEMPRMNGLEFTRHIRNSSQYEKLPVLMLTSRNQSKHRQMAEKAGVTDYATKPYNETQLMDQIRDILA
ncbi:chemotaxis response regulator receiver-modulated signal transduction histidine kinase [Oleiphilus messinensis]|uniref:Chemotaxis protein CheA n=2 Tax=Oleiphilus messinensis TaxID=141451 RepID=A0A1Y0IC28_9GAMM|nr:chemotaxis response regulator receiver-modulated signal transduction histidine kinase [Oleiphilus messinensis]